MLAERDREYLKQCRRCPAWNSQWKHLVFFHDILTPGIGMQRPSWWQTKRAGKSVLGTDILFTRYRRIHCYMVMHLNLVRIPFLHLGISDHWGQVDRCYFWWILRSLRQVRFRHYVLLRMILIMFEFLLQGTKGKSSQPHQLAQVGLVGTSLPLLDSWDWDWNGSKSFLKKVPCAWPIVVGPTLLKM